MESMQSSSILEPPSLEDLFKKYDRTLVITLEKFHKTVNNMCDVVERKLERTERKLHRYTKGVKKQVEKELHMADCLVSKELRSKVIMSEWTSTFLSATSDVTLDPVTFAFARFALNICLCYTDVSASYFIHSKIHVLLVSLMQFNSELVVGPAVLGLLHLSLHYEMKHEIVAAANALPAILKLLVESKSDVILTQCCKLVASLAMHPPNKSPIVSSGCYHGVIDMIGGIRTGNDHVRTNACKAAVNIVQANDANRVLSVELDAIKPLLSVIQYGFSDISLYNSIRALANIAFMNSFTSSKILAAGGDQIFVDVLNSGDILVQPDINRATLIAITNLCCSESNQSHVGACKGMLECVVRICEFAKEPWVVSEAANLLLALSWRNTGNKARIAAHGGCQVLLRRVVYHAPYEDEDHVVCMEKCCLALSSLMLYKSNHEKLNEAKGLKEINRLCKKGVSRRLLAAASTIIATLIPSPGELRRMHIDCTPVAVETVNVLPTLKRVQLFAFGHVKSPPSWLTEGISVLSMSDDELGTQNPWVKVEFVEKETFFKELSAEIAPEVDFNTFPAAKGLIFSIQ